MELAHLEPWVVTAGAYIRLAALGNLVPFMVGPTPSGDGLGVVRLGGHREAHESSWACARREALEEACLHIAPLPPPITYAAAMDDVDAPLAPGTWRLLAGDDAMPCSPLLAARRAAGPAGPVSVMYLAHSEDVPTPAAETRGLLLLDRAGIMRLTIGAPLTLRHYLALGGRALLREDLSLDLPLLPFAQLRWLARMLEQHPDLVPG